MLDTNKIDTKPNLRKSISYCIIKLRYLFYNKINIESDYIFLFW